MPELPEVETVRRGLAEAMIGRRILAVDQRRHDLRRALPPNFAARLAGRTVERVDRRAKYLLARLSEGLVLIMHLGMSGRFTIKTGNRVVSPGDFYFEEPREPGHDHVIFRLEDGATIVYNDSRRFGLMDLIEESGLAAHPLLAKLGVEPLSEAFSAAVLTRAFSGRAMNLKAALLDQKFIAGLGNIYVCEALHRAGIAPQRTAGSLTQDEADRLTLEIRSVLTEAIEAGGSTLRDYSQTDGAQGSFQEAFKVYDRERKSCTRAGCGGSVARIVQAGRSTFYCTHCQT